MTTRVTWHGNTWTLIIRIPTLGAVEVIEGTGHKALAYTLKGL
jgi:hypothetical protein